MLTLELLKRQVNVDFDNDDEYLLHLLDAAVAHTRTATARTEDELNEIGGGHEWPAPLQHAALMLASHWYNQREAVASTAMSEVPLSFEALVKPYRKLAD